jgi:hypothetical protein
MAINKLRGDQIDCALIKMLHAGEDHLAAINLFARRCCPLLFKRRQGQGKVIENEAGFWTNGFLFNDARS